MKIVYSCEGCGAAYETKKKALACEALTIAPTVKIGDIVTCRAGFGWANGDHRWISNPKAHKAPGGCPNGNGNCFDACCTYAFFYVVTAIDLDLHRPRYHLATKAMNEVSGYSNGYTFDAGHCAPTLVSNPPPEIVADSLDLLGRKSDHLI